MKRAAKFAVTFVVLLLFFVGYVWAALSWSYSSGERAGWIQKFSRKGWLCKTWEGEMAMVTMPGSTPEKFYFTVRDESVAQRINAVVGRRVALAYEEKIGLPTSCFGDTRHFVTGVRAVEDILISPGVAIPNPPGTPVDPPPEHPQ